MSYFNTISFGMGTLFVRGISEIAEFRISVLRLKAFLMNEEFKAAKPEASVNGIGKNIDSTKGAIYIENLSAKWNRNNSDLALENINLKVPRGHLVGVIGPVGSGKSSLLNTILGKLKLILVHIHFSSSAIR